MQTQTGSRVEFANTLRGFAAICVLIYHYGYIFWHERQVTASLVGAPPLSDSAFATPTYLLWVARMEPVDLGAYGVALFFLISGFVIPFSFRTTSAGGFAIARVLRIYPTYMVGFSCTALAVYLCSRYFGFPTPFTASDALVHYFPGLQDLSMHRSIDGIIWTLNIEFKFYLVCVFLASMLRTGSAAALVAPLALSVVAWFLYPYANAGKEWSLAVAFVRLAIQTIDYMFVGVVFNFYLRKTLRLPGALLAITALLAAMAIVWQQGSLVRMSQMWAYGVALATFALGFAVRGLIAPNRVTSFFADISYPLYVVHGVLGYACIRVMLQWGWRPIVSITSTALFVIALATLLHFAVEKPSHALGRRFK